MKGEKTLKDIPFRYGGIEHDYDSSFRDWYYGLQRALTDKRLYNMYRTCYACNSDMHFNTSEYPYIATFKYLKGKNKGLLRFRILCRECAYKYGKGVIEMDAETYYNMDDFNEREYKERIKKCQEKKLVDLQ